MDIVNELYEQVKEWRSQQELIEDMIEEAYHRIDSLLENNKKGEAA